MHAQVSPIRDTFVVVNELSTLLNADSMRLCWGRVICPSTGREMFVWEIHFFNEGLKLGAPRARPGKTSPSFFFQSSRMKRPCSLRMVDEFTPPPSFLQRPPLVISCVSGGC